MTDQPTVDLTEPFTDLGHVAEEPAPAEPEKPADPNHCLHPTFDIGFGEPDHQVRLPTGVAVTCPTCKLTGVYQPHHLEHPDPAALQAKIDTPPPPRLILPGQG